MKAETMARRLRQCEAQLKELKGQLEQHRVDTDRLKQLIMVLDRSYPPT